MAFCALLSEESIVWYGSGVEAMEKINIRRCLNYLFLFTKVPQMHLKCTFREIKNCIRSNKTL